MFNIVKHLTGAKIVSMSGNTQFSEDQLKIIFENFLNTFNSEINSQRPPREDTKPLTAWIHLEKKEKYDEIQKLTRLQFGKVLQAAITASIDKTYDLLKNKAA